MEMYTVISNRQPSLGWECITARFEAPRVISLSNRNKRATRTPRRLIRGLSLRQEILNLETNSLHDFLLETTRGLDGSPYQHRPCVLQTDLHGTAAGAVQLLPGTVTNVDRDVRADACTPQSGHPLPMVQRGVRVIDRDGTGECVSGRELISRDERDAHHRRR